VLILYSKVTKNLASLTLDNGLLFGPPCIIDISCACLPQLQYLCALYVKAILRFLNQPSTWCYSLLVTSWASPGFLS